jgi:hypothetical protein
MLRILFIAMMMVPVHRSVREHHGALLISYSALLTYFTVKVLVDILCLCSLVQSKTTLFLVDEKGLETMVFRVTLVTWPMRTPITVEWRSCLIDLQDVCPQENRLLLFMRH